MGGSEKLAGAGEKGRRQAPALIGYSGPINAQVHRSVCRISAIPYPLGLLSTSGSSLW